MAYFIDPTVMADGFLVPKSVVDDYINMANYGCLKVLLWLFRNIGNGADKELAAKELSMESYEIDEAFAFWETAGILKRNGAESQKGTPAAKKRAVAAVIKPGREESAKRGLESPQIAFLLREAEMRLGRTLRQSEISTLVWLYDSEGLSSAVLLMIIEYVFSEERPSIRLVEKIAVEWANRGIIDINDAEDEIVKLRSRHTAWRVVSSIVGLERRNPSPKELDAVSLWVNDWGFGKDLLKEAYNRCVDSTSKFSISYMGKILSRWHSEGIKTVEQLKRDNTREPVTAGAKGGAKNAAYDLDKALKSMYGD